MTYDLSLIPNIANEVLPYITLKERSLFHNIISLVISQRVRFQVGRDIRNKLYELLLSDNITIKGISKLSDKELKKIGIEQYKIDIIRYIVMIYKPELSVVELLQQLCEIKGIGIWTIKSLKILNDLDNETFLSEDYYIRQRLSELVKSECILTSKECQEIASKYWDKREFTLVSKFLWRIKPEGINIILKEERKLEKHDFL